MNSEYDIKAMKMLIDEMKDTLEQKKDLINQLQKRIDIALEYIKKEWYSKNTKDINKMVSFHDWKIDLYNILDKGNK